MILISHSFHNRVILSYRRKDKFTEGNDVAVFRKKNNDLIHMEEVSDGIYVPVMEHSNKKRGKKSMALIVALCMTLSAAVGVGGGYYMKDLSQQSQGAADVGAVKTAASADASAQQSSGNLTVAEVAAMVADSVVEITTESIQTGSIFQQYVTEGAGSGVIVTTDGYIATNNHVIEGASKISVTLHNGKAYDATLVGADSKTDLAVIKIEASDLQPAVMGTSSTLVVGETAIAVGNPLGSLGGTVTDGIISALSREIQIDDTTMTLLQTNAAINPGNSGGGLFNAKGELIGIVSAKSSGTGIEGLGFAIPIDTAKPVIEQLKSNGYVKGRVDTGLSLIDISNVQTAFLYRVSRTGLYVQQVTGENAAKAGFKSGDRIIAVNGEEISGMSDFNLKLDACKVGDTVTITVVRNMYSYDLSLKLSEYVPSK